MAFMICQKHGGHGASAVCRHIADAVIQSQPIGPVAPVRVAYEGCRFGPILFCFACADRCGIPSDGLLLTGDDGLDRMYALDWVPVCPLCLRDSGGPSE